MVRSVILVDDHPLLRAGARGVVESDSAFEVVAECADGEAAIEAVVAHRPDIVLVDLGLPDLSGVEVIQKIAGLVPECRAVVFSQHREPHYVESSLLAGAAGYVLKDDPPEELVRCLHRVADGQSHVSASINSLGARRRASLSGRECEVVKLISEGYSSKEIAETLGIAPRTVDAHRGRIMSKLGIHKITGLVRFAIREGYVSP